MPYLSYSERHSEPREQRHRHHHRAYSQRHQPARQVPHGPRPRIEGGLRSLA